MTYDYKDGKKRVEEILSGAMEVKESSELPSIDNLTFDNAYLSWVTAIFVDIRDSTTLMKNEDQQYVAKTVRSFTSEIIEILRGDDREREIGIRGDCVYAIYTTPYTTDIYEIFDKAAYANTYLKMLNKILDNHGYDRIRAGIGVSTGHDHVIKAGRKGAGINSVVWMGDAVSEASNLSDYGDKDGISRIVLSSTTYINIIAEYNKRFPEKNPESWFRTSPKLPYGARYCNVIMTEMDEWIDSGMPS